MNIKTPDEQLDREFAFSRQPHMQDELCGDPRDIEVTCMRLRNHLPEHEHAAGWGSQRQRWWT